MLMKDLPEIARLAGEFIEISPLNVVEELGSLRIYDKPVLGLAAADDPLFSRLKDPEIIGPHHLNPGEWLPEAQTVISYFLPFSERIREANRGEGDPPVEWLYGRIEGEICNDALRRHLVNEIEKMGGRAVVPPFDPRYQAINMRSNWSERHVAFIAGLGTFNLSKSMITEKGCAGRFGSVVVTARYEPTPRRYTEVYEYCTNCGACIHRCPPGAISMAGKDHSICSQYINEKIKKRFAPRYGCGKCQTAVPCEHAIP